VLKEWEGPPSSRRKDWAEGELRRKRKKKSVVTELLAMDFSQAGEGERSRIPSKHREGQWVFVRRTQLGEGGEVVLSSRRELRRGGGRGHRELGNGIVTPENLQREVLLMRLSKVAISSVSAFGVKGREMMGSTV